LCICILISNNIQLDHLTLYDLICSCNIGEGGIALAEAVHGSAPDIAGKVRPQSGYMIFNIVVSLAPWYVIMLYAFMIFNIATMLDLPLSAISADIYFIGRPCLED
jgi:hypothetical protein